MRVRFLFPLLLLLAFCTDERNVFDGLPYLRTTITNISVQGATFNAAILNSTSGITDRGFVWSSGININYEGSERKSVGAGDGTSSFSTLIEFGLSKNTFYTVASYIVAGGVKIYGEPVTFISLGSKGPTITDFMPRKAKATEIVQITGTGFSTIPSQNTILLNSTAKSTLLAATSASETAITFKVPNNLTGSTFTLSVLTPGGTATAPATFEFDPISPYQVLSVNKTAVALCEELIITTNDIPSSAAITMYFNGVAVNPFSRDGNILHVSTPPLPATTTVITLELVAGSLRSTFPITLSYLKPEINSFTGSLTTGSTVSVSAQNLPACDIKSSINGSSVTLLNFSPDHFEFVVPPGVGSSFNLDLGLNGNFGPFLTYNFH